MGDKRLKIDKEILANPDMVRQLEQEMEQELKKIERENADLREEIAILKKAQHIFSNQRN